MAFTLTKTTTKTKASRLERIKADQEVHDIILAHEPVSEFKRFQDLIAVLFGPTGIGKTSFAINIPNYYVLATEPINNPAPFRRTELTNWPTFKAFIDDMEKNPLFVKTVSMWAIDSIDFLVSKCITTVCYDWGITDLSDEGWSRAWIEMKDELIFNLCRLKALGPGILIISHERERKKTKKDSMDLSDSIFNAVSFLSTIVMHMRYVKKSETSKELGHLRCISVTGSDDEDAKDNTDLLRAACGADGVIKFKTEKIAVDKILSCFDNEVSVIKHKKSKKKKKKTKAKRR